MVRNQTLEEYMRRLGQLVSGVKNKEFKIETENKSTNQLEKMIISCGAVHTECTHFLAIFDSPCTKNYVIVTYLLTVHAFETPPSPPWYVRNV